MAQATLYYQVHVLIALALFALWPFTRLVHAFSAPIAYLFRPLHRVPQPRGGGQARIDRFRAASS
ncbi:respiratory nitrate reductase subunit gamma [Mycobacterium tuberculosis]